MGVKLNSTGGGSVHLEAPVTAANRTVTVPDVDGTLLVSSTDGSSIISANSATDALRITQTGAGNALVVEDSANPDSTPFVIDASGKTLVGITTARTTVSDSMPFQIEGTGYATSSMSLTSNTNGSANQASIVISKTRGTTTGSVTSVISGDILGACIFGGADGSSIVSAAQISAAVDGTPGTNDMPGRLVFSTTADGASSPTERMRITSAGWVGFSILPSATSGIIRFGNDATGGTVVRGITNDMTVQSDVTSGFSSFRSQTGTEAASFTLGSMSHFIAAPGTFGAGSTVTNQYGFYATSSLTGATNNYGFYGDIASGTGRWNFYAAGSAENYFAGQMLIGNATSTDASVNLLVSSATGSATPVPTELRIATTTSASDWSTTDPWGRISFYSADTSYAGPKIQASIDTVSNSSNGGVSSLVFLTATDSGVLTKRLDIDSGGGITLSSNASLFISKTSVTAPAASDGNVFSGTYTPTLTNTTNVAASTAYPCQYMRVGATVTVSGLVDIDPTSANADTVLELSLPIASNFAQIYQCGGTFVERSVQVDVYGCISSNVTSDTAQFRFYPVDLNNRSYMFTFTYRII